MKIGTRVAVVDEDLSGIITSVNGKIISFKDEFGFIHQYSEEKLVISNPELYDNIQIQKKKEIPKTISKKHQRNHLVLDLHFEKIAGSSSQHDSFERLFLQKEKLMETIDFCRKNNLKKLEIVHGIGDGTLQKMVWDTLESLTNIDFYNKEILHHQSGAVMVEFH